MKVFREAAAFLNREGRESRTPEGTDRKKWTLEKAKDKAMFQGMMIEELIHSVERAEQHAREEQGAKLDFYDYPVRRMESREWFEVA